MPSLEKTGWGDNAESQEYTETLSLAIVEPRKHESMRAILMNVCHIWGGSGRTTKSLLLAGCLWRAVFEVLDNCLHNRTGARLYIFHGTHNMEWMEELVQEIGITGAVMKNIGVENLDRFTYSAMWCTVEFYEHFPTTHLLCFQTDVLMRRRIPAKFFQYDYVGAPWTACIHPVMKDAPGRCFAAQV